MRARSGFPLRWLFPEVAGCFGSVAERYRISTFEVTTAQYTEFLNAVAATDANALYNTSRPLT